MNAAAFRHLYDYHFAENRKLWQACASALTDEQFSRPAGYSRGSVRQQLLHLMAVDEIWFCELQGRAPAEPPEDAEGRLALRARWDQLEQEMRGYLAGLQDTQLFARPIQDPEEDQPLATWQVLLQVVNHGTDHRAQLLRQLNDLGVKTSSQDYIFYCYEHPLPEAAC